MPLSKSIALLGAALLAAPLAAQHGPPPGQGHGLGPRPVPPLFISPFGEPFRSGSREAGLVAWFARADADSDGAIVSLELHADAARFHAALDVDRDGEIEPSEMARYEFEIAPEIQVGRGPMSERERRQMRRADRRQAEAEARGIRTGNTNRAQRARDGAGRFGLLDIPQPVMDADTDMNRGVTAGELSAAADARFVLLDTDKDGKLTVAELTPQLPTVAILKRGREKGRRP